MGGLPARRLEMEIVVAVALTVVALWLFIAIDWWKERRTRQRIMAALADEDDEVTNPMIPITVVEPSTLPPLDTYELKHPWFAQASRWLATRRNWGPN
jgi:hypothetical protein